MMPIKLIAVDIGGTLINDNNTISREDIETFRKLKQSGIKVCLTTARMYSSTKYISNIISSDYGVFGNGSVVMNLNNKEIISAAVLTKEDKADIINFGKCNNLYIHFSQFFWEGSDEQKYFLLKHQLLNQKYEESLKSNVKQVDNLYEYVIHNDDIVNLVLVSEDNMDDFYKKLIQDYPNVYVTEYYKNCLETAINKTINYIEISKKHTNKKVGLDKLIEHLKLIPDEVLVIGDGKNDIEMFEKFPNSGCLANGDDQAKQCAQYLSTKTNNESGVSEIVEHYRKIRRIL